METTLDTTSSSNAPARTLLFKLPSKIDSRYDRDMLEFYWNFTEISQQILVVLEAELVTVP